MYNANINEDSVMKDDQICRDMWRVMSKFLSGGEEPTKSRNKKSEFFTIIKSRRRDLTEKRDILKNSLINLTRDVGRQVENHPGKLIEIVSRSNEMMVNFAGTIIDEAIKFMGTDRPPCDFSAVGIGSLGRGEATPYSDLEYLFLIEKSECRPYFEKLAVLTYCIIGALNETKLNSIAISELNGDKEKGIEKGWFIDGRQYGYQIDGITSTSDNVPTRAKSLWKLEDSGGFIATPKQMLREYKEVLENPTEEALKGDITSMLMFTKLLYSINKGKSQYEKSQENVEELLLSSFESGRNELNRNKNAARLGINLEMLKNDLNKFVFHPEYDLYSSGFNLNVKTELYRFPSILLLDLTTIVDEVGSDSWSTLNMFKVRFSKGFAEHLSRLLAFACFSRLRCYLAMDAHSDSFKIGGKRGFPSGVGDTGQSISYRVSNTWEMSRDEFFLLCKDLISMQRHMQSQPIRTPNDVSELMSKDITEDPLPEILAHYYCCEWSEVIGPLEGNYRNYMYKDYQCRIALAFSHMKLEEYLKATRILEGLRDDFILDRTVEDVVQINVMRLLSKSLSKALNDEGGTSSKVPKMSSGVPYETTFHMIKSLPLDRREKLRRIVAFVLFEYGMFLSERKRENAKACDFLYKALQIFVLDAATQPKCANLKVLNNFLYWNAVQRLDWIGNETRELAHCVYTIATLLQDKEVAKIYYKKAEKLGLEFFIRFGTDNYTQIMILTDLGKALENKQYLRGALALLERSCGKDSNPELKTEIMVSIVECIGQASEDISHSVELENQLEIQLDQVITDSKAQGDDTEDDKKLHESLLNNNRTDSWYSRAIKALKDLPTDLTKEDSELLRGLKEKFDLLGMDTTPFSELMNQSTPKKTDAGTQTTEPPPRQGTKPAATQTTSQSFETREAQTEALNHPKDIEVQTDWTINTSREAETQTKDQPDLPSLRGTQVYISVQFYRTILHVVN